MALAAVLLFVFHFVVTKPLIRLANNLGKIDAANPNKKRISAIPNHKGSEIGYIVNTVNEFIDAAEDHQINLASLEKQLRMIINTVPLIVYAIDQDNRFVFANSNTALFYRKRFHQLTGANYSDVHSPNDEKEALFMTSEYESVFLAKKDRQLDNILLTNHDAQKAHFEVTLIPFHSFDQNSVLVVMNDITERIESQKAIEKLAYHDALTGLANRTLFQDRLNMDIRRAERFNHFGALLFIDLDKFKLINDTLGHAMGDELLVEVSRKLTKRIRELDTIARMGGDEFAVSLSELGDTEEKAIELATSIAEEFNVILNSEIDLAGQGYQISASIGLVCYPHTSNDVPTLLRYADAAMYQAKNEGRHQVRVFEQQMIDRVTKQVQLEKEIHQAFDQNEFTIVIQPLYSGSSSIPVAGEVLIRWQHPEKGLLGPNEFLDYVESLNLMHLISSAVISQCSDVIKKLDTAKLLDMNFKFAINISTLEFYEPDFTQRILSSIQSSGVPLELFELEITEGIALHDLQLAKAKLREFEAMGITVALDDFGTGYSSLSYLKNLNVNKLKVDKSFIDDIETDIQDQKLVDSIIAIADNFEVEVVIEGVENSAQLAWLSKHKSLIYQGYHFNKPLLQNDFINELSKFNLLK
jgi:diguanylate cyclase (GGDEF)-like protein/PAS domain S-box-containing protein